MWTELRQIMVTQGSQIRAIEAGNACLTICSRACQAADRTQSRRRTSYPDEGTLLRVA